MLGSYNCLNLLRICEGYFLPLSYLHYDNLELHSNVMNKATAASVILQESRWGQNLVHNQQRPSPLCSDWLHLSPWYVGAGQSNHCNFSGKFSDLILLKAETTVCHLQREVGSNYKLTRLSIEVKISQSLVSVPGGQSYTSKRENKWRFLLNTTYVLRPNNCESDLPTARVLVAATWESLPENFSCKVTKGWFRTEGRRRLMLFSWGKLFSQKIIKSVEEAQHRREGWNSSAASSAFSISHNC